MQRVISRAQVLWCVILFSSVGVALYALVGYSLRPLGSLVHPEMKLAYEAHRLAVYAHIFTSLVALALGPVQFLSSFRERRVKLHRVLGRVYLLCVLLGGSAGLYVATIAHGGIPSKVGFAMLAVLWLFTAYRAYFAIRNGRIEEHRRWMLRNFALTFAAVTLRIYLGLFFASGLAFDRFYPVLAWISWVPNLLLIEWLVLGRQQSATSPTAGN